MERTTTPTTTNAGVINNIVLFILYFLLLLIVGISFDKISKNSTGVSPQTFTYAFIGIFIGISILITINGGSLDPRGISYSSLLTGVTLLFTIFVFIGMVYFFNNNNYFVIGIFILIAIVGLALIFNIFYNIFERSIRNTEIKFVFEFIFFLPCLFNDILKWGLGQIHMTSYLTYVLLLIEIILVILYFYLPTILNRIFVGKDGKVLQRAPFYINKGNRAVIATSADLSTEQSAPDGTNLLDNNDIVKKYNTSYALSMWINVNPHQISSNKEIDILSYFYRNNETDNEFYKPKITYSSNTSTDSPSLKDVYRIYLTGGKGSGTNKIEIHVPNQKWNNFVFNYIDGKMVELWVNGVMERVMTFSDGIPVPLYNSTDQIVIGSSTATGTNGAICNVIYFDKSITSYQIVNLYNYGMTSLQGTNSYPH